MGKLETAGVVGLRDKDTKDLIAVYPFKAAGSDEKIINEVKDWYYKQSCSAEETLRNAFVDGLSDNELKSYRLNDQ